MKLLSISLLLLMPHSMADPALTYPSARRDSLVEKLHGVDVADPYRWMEDIDSKETRSWVEGQAALAGKYLETLPGRSEILQRLKVLQDYDKHGVPVRIAGRLFYSRRSGLQNQSILYWKNDAPDGVEKVLLDPNILSKDGTIALSNWAITDDGEKLCYGLSEAGSDWNTLHFRTVKSGEDLPDVLQWVKFSNGSWSHDGRGLYYSRYAAPPKGQELKAENLNQKVFFHNLSESQEMDALVYARPDFPKWGLSAAETDDGKFLVISASEGTKDENAFFYRRLGGTGESPVVEMLPKFDADWRFLGNDGDVFFFLTTKEAPNRRIVSLNVAAPETLTTLVTESKNVIAGANMIGGRLIVQRLVDAHDDVTIYNLTGKEIRKVELPNFGSAGGFTGRAMDTETFYGVTGFDTPGTVYRLNLTTGNTSTHVATAVPSFDPAAITVEQVFYPSKDGTKVPMFLVSKKGTVRNGANPVILYAYGGFNIDLTPSFSASRLAWLEKGGVYAQACLRGGGEYGRAWHEAGMKQKKQNVFDDFIAAAEYLIREKWTTPARLAIQGGSNGGLLVAACVLQRPELFGCALPAVGVHDMLRFHKFTIGWAWQEEYGSPDKAEDFKALFGYSPVHNVRAGIKLPPTLILTGDHDDRVYPAHSFKLAAAMQHAQSSIAPVLLRVDLRAGHGAGKPTAKVLEEIADTYAFALNAGK